MTRFEEVVLLKLDSIESRLLSIEERFDEATNFADGVLSDENGVFGPDGLASIKDALTSFMPTQMDQGVTNLAQANPETLQELAGSLRDFRDRLAGIKTAMESLPDEGESTEVDAE